MRTRPVLLTAGIAAVGLAALGTVVAQQPPAGYGLPRMQQPAPAGAAPTGPAPAPGVRPYAEWTPTAAPAGYIPKQPQTGVQQAGGTLPIPPGYTPVPNPNGRPRLTNPVMAGPDGVRPAGGFDVPAPSMDVPAFRPGAGVAPPGAAPTPAPAGRPFAPPGVRMDPVESKFSPAPPAADPRPPAPAVPPLVPPTVSPVPSPAPVTPPPSGSVVPIVPAPAPFAGPESATPPAAAPTSPTPPPAAVAPAPVFGPPGGVAPATGPTVTVVPTPPAAGGTTPPAAPPATAPGTPAAPAVTASPTVLPSRTSPSVVVEAVCPESVGFGQEFQYKLIVRNTGTAVVSYVRLEDEVPAGARFVGSDPAAELNGDRLVWTLGALDAGAEKHFTVRVKPGEEGEARSRATVTFASAVDARTRVTRPRLTASATGIETCRAGEEMTFQIKVTNGGSGPAAKMIVQAHLSDGLYHPQAQKGGLIEAELPTLPAGETRTVPLKVSAVRAGLQWCQVVVAADGSPDATAKASVNVVEPMLVVKQAGPAKCLVGGSDPVFTIDLANPGTAATDPVQLHAVLPDGFELAANGASDGGAATGRTVTWRLPSLPAGSTRAVTLKLRAVAATEESLLRTIAQAGPSAVTPAAGTGATGVAVRPGRGLEAKAESVISAEGVAAVRFDLIGLDNPVPVGKEATYEVRVMNRGTGPCSNVQLAAALADGTEFVGATSGATNQAAGVKAQGQQLVFDPIPTLGVKGEMVYRVRVKGNAPGDLRFRVQLGCDQLKAPLLKEESTTFYKE